jgi:hypothetical protein
MDKQKEDLNRDNQKKIEDKTDIKKADVVKTKKKGRAIKPWIFLVVFNILMLLASVYLMTSLPKKAQQLNQVLSDEQKVKESKRVDVTGLEYQPTKESVEKLMRYFPEEPGVIDFMEAVEEMEEKGLLKNFSLASQDTVKDRTGAYGIPFVVEFEGTWESIGTSLQEFQKLPYLVRAINIEAAMVDEKTVIFKYGGFLYVSDKLAKTR